MPLFTKGPAPSFRDGIKDLDSDRFKHLDKMIVAGKAVGRTPEMGGTTVVFLPYPNFDNPKYKETIDVLPDRLSDDPMDYGRWMFYADGVQKFGVNPVSLLFDDPSDDGFNPREHNPVWMIYEAVDRVVRAAQVVETPFGTSESDRWELLLMGDRKNRVYPKISRPDQVVMAYAAVYSSGKKAYHLEGVPFGAAAGDLPVVFVMSRYSATKALAPALDVMGQDGKPVNKDITGVKYIHFYDRQKGDCQAMRNAVTAQASSLGFGHRRQAPVAAAGEAPGGQLAGYGVYVSDTFSGLPDAPKNNRREVAGLSVNKVRPWEQVLRGHTPEQAARTVADCCGLPLSILYHAWKSMPEYYSDEMRHRLRNPVTAEVRAPAAHQGGLGSSYQQPAAAAEQTEDPGLAPWGGHISDPPASPETDRGGDDGPPDADGEDLGYDPGRMQEALNKFRSMQAGAPNAPAAARSQAAKPPRK